MDVSARVLLVAAVALGSLGACGESPEPPAPPPAESPREREPAAPPSSPGPKAGEWTAGIVEQDRPNVERPVTIVDIETGRHEDYDRVVFIFAAHLPGYHLEYIDEPVRECGSGRPVEMAGDGWLEIAVSPARAHTDAGEATVGSRSRQLDLPVVRQLEVTCDFEGRFVTVLGVAAPNRYRVLTLDDPPRVVVDIRHR